ALRDHIREKMHLEEFASLPPILKSYAQEVLHRKPAVYPKGRNIANSWCRDVAIAVLVSMAAAQWPLPVTRNRATKRPSACLIVALALNKRGYPLGERQVERIYRDHNKLAARLDLSAFLER